MFGSIFSGVDKIGRGLDASWTKNEVISSNIANIDTPGYKRKKVEFGDLLDDKLSSSRLKNKKNESPYIKISTDTSTANMRTDENNVNIDTEMSDLSKNQIYYNVLIQRATGEINKIQSAIRDV